MIGTHIGLNPKAQQQMLGKQITVDLIPQGVPPPSASAPAAADSAAY